jgi:hypothetical protein
MNGLVTYRQPHSSFDSAPVFPIVPAVSCRVDPPIGERGNGRRIDPPEAGSGRLTRVA